ncbi:MAG: hypothetical protein SF069_10125 [Phycisphaerae bacterium]|nr:hypothetical protein [Phycisphaerae bacterium]
MPRLLATWNGCGSFAPAYTDATYSELPGASVEFPPPYGALLLDQPIEGAITEVRVLPPELRANDSQYSGEPWFFPIQVIFNRGDNDGVRVGHQFFVVAASARRCDLFEVIEVWEHSSLGRFIQATDSPSLDQIAVDWGIYPGAQVSTCKVSRDYFDCCELLSDGFYR